MQTKKIRLDDILSKIADLIGEYELKDMLVQILEDEGDLPADFEHGEDDHKLTYSAIGVGGVEVELEWPEAEDEEEEGED